MTAPRKTPALAPPGATSLTVLSSAAVDNFEKQAGGRARLLEVLSAHPAISRADRLALDLIADPRSDTKSLSTLCGKAGISLGRLLQLYKDAHVMRGQVAAIEAIAARAAPVAREVLDAAFKTEEVCARCKGLGTLVRTVRTGDTETTEPMACPDCEGTGTEMRRPTTADRKLAAEVVGLVKGGGGVEVNVSASAQAGSLSLAGAEDDFFIRLQEATDHALYGEVRGAARRAAPPTIDVEVTEAHHAGEQESACDVSPSPDPGADPSAAEA